MSRSRRALLGNDGMRATPRRSRGNRRWRVGLVWFQTPRRSRDNPRWHVLMLRTFDFAVKGAANKSAQGIAQGGLGIAVGARGDRVALARVSRPRRLTRPPGLPAHRRPRYQSCSCLLSLLQTKETYRSSIWAGSGDPRPARADLFGPFGAKSNTCNTKNAPARGRDRRDRVAATLAGASG